MIPSKEEKENIIELIHKKFNKLPNIGYLHIWLQRMTYGINKDKNYEETLCKKIINPDTKVW